MPYSKIQTSTYSVKVLDYVESCKYYMYVIMHNVAIVRGYDACAYDVNAHMTSDTVSHVTVLKSRDVWWIAVDSVHNSVRMFGVML